MSLHHSKVHSVDFECLHTRTILSSPWTRTSSRFSVTSSAVSSWIDAVPSRSSSPSPSEWVVLPPPHSVNQPPPLPSTNAGYRIPPPGHHPSHLSPVTYASLSPSDLGSVSSRRTSSSTHTRSSTHHRSERGPPRMRPLDTIPCQICLQLETECTCVGGEDARRRMRKGARKVLNRAEGAMDARETQRDHEPHVAPQAWGPTFAQRSGDAAGYGAPMAYAGSPVPGYSGQPTAMGGYASGYYGSLGVAPTSQAWVDEQQGVSGPVWGFRGG